MNFDDYFNISNIITSIISLIFGFLGGYLSNRILQSSQQHHAYIGKQLDHLYGPAYAQIIKYKINRSMVDAIIAHHSYSDKDLLFSPFRKDEYQGDDDKVMMVEYAKNAFVCFEKIHEIVTSNISFAHKKDIQSIENLSSSYYYYNSAYGHPESPDMFYNYLQTSKLKNDFIDSMINSYDGLKKSL